MTDISDVVRKLYEKGEFHEWLDLSFDRAEPGLAEFSIHHLDPSPASAIHPRSTVVSWRPLSTSLQGRRYGRPTTGGPSASR